MKPKPIGKKLATRNKNKKFPYYAKVISWQLVPGFVFRAQRSKALARLKTLETGELEAVRARVNYYNKLSTITPLSDSAIPLGKLGLPQKQKVYYFDTQQYTRYFDPHLKANFLFGDVRHTPEEPAIVKSRPLDGDNANSIVLKLDKLRHFNFITDTRAFRDKKDMLLGRGVVKREHRVRFFEMYFDHPMCNLGQVNRDRNEHWVRDFLTIEEHLDYKFILCLEGNDVATNLKWVMSSNSLPVMPRPKFETWYMEGTLIPNHHYVEIKSDYSDLEERLNFYISHPEEAERIIQNAHAYVEQFRNPEQEKLISLLVLEKLFYRTGQCDSDHKALFDRP
jgi:hypothetical protein